MQIKLTSFLLLLLPLLWTACNSNTLSEDSSKPADNRFTKVVLTQGMDEPMTMDFLPDQRIIIVERKGGVKIYDEASEMITLVATIPVNTKYKNKEGRIREAEEGLMGVI
nr:PQQ-dependent sugar dehydrogenase [Saprospiraceae bacterium]